MGQISNNINSCMCFCNKGQATLKCQFQKETYMPTETCHALADVDNTACQLPCTALVISLTRYIEL